MAFFSEAFYSSHLPASAPPLSPSAQANELDAEIDKVLDDAVDFLSSSDVEKLLSSSPGLATPQARRSVETPPSSVNDKPSSSAAKRKRVDFAPFTSTSWGWAADVSPHVQKENSSALLLRKLQPSKERNTLRSKSILKPSTSRDNEQRADMEEEVVQTWTQTLDFCLGQLRNERPGTRLDAWRAMHHVLTKDPEIVTTEGLEEKHNQLLTFANRDITHRDKIHVDGPPNELPNFALLFLSRWLRSPSVCSQLSLAVAGKLLRTATDQLQSSDTSKKLVLCYMELFAHQNLNPEVMTASRARKIVEATNRAGLRHRSSAIPMSQINIVKKLVDQSPDGMVASAQVWLGMLVQGLLSEDPQLFRMAVNTAFYASINLGNQNEVADALQRLLNGTEDSEEGRNTVQHVQGELLRKADFALDTNQATLVPKAVAAILMFLRSRGPSSVLGPSFRPLVSVFTPYFRKSHVSITLHAHTAWNYVIISHLYGGERWPDTEQAMLIRPMEDMLMRSKADTNFERGTPAFTLASYHLLLYCCFTSNINENHQAITEKWDVYVSSVLRQMLSRSESHVKVAVRIICTLLSSPTQWDPQKLYKIQQPWTQPLIEITDLARIQPRWIRAHLGFVLQLLDVVFESASKAEYSLPIWRALLDALTQAEEKEVTATKERKAATAQIANHLTQLWGVYRLSAQDIVLFGQLLAQLLEDSCGTRYTEKILRKTNDGNNLEVATTPSNRTGSMQRPTSAILHALHLLVRELISQSSAARAATTSGSRADVLLETIKDVAYKICNSERTLSDKVKFLAEQVRYLVQKTGHSSLSASHSYLTQLCHHYLVSIQDLLVKPQSYGLQASESLEQCYRQLASAIADVACYMEVLSNPLSECYKAIMNKAITDLGPAGALLQVTEATARNIHQKVRDVDNLQHFCRDSTLLDIAETIISTTPTNVPSSDIRKALERYNNDLNQALNKRLEVVDRFHMLNEILVFGYNHLLDNDKEDMSQALAAVLRTLPDSLGALFHAKAMQSGIAAVVVDKEGRIFSEQAPGSCIGLVHELWQVLLSRQLFKQSEQSHVSAFDELISAGLSSRSSRIVNDSVEAWNRWYGANADLVYPSRIAKAIRKLSRHGIDVHLASPLPLQDNEVPDSPLVVETFEHARQAENAPRLQPPTPRPMPQLQRLAPSPAAASPSKRRVASTTPKKKPRPRHEDSQIHFEPIVSSPLPQPAKEVLTERQIEVAERQQQKQAANLVEAFSPMPCRRKERPAQVPDEEPAAPTPATPVLAPAIDDALPSSSPVVASVKRRAGAARRLSMNENRLSSTNVEAQDEIPSSPPVMAEQTSAGQNGPIPMISLNDGQPEHILHEEQVVASTEEETGVEMPAANVPNVEHNDGPAEAVNGISQTQSFNSILSNPASLVEPSSIRVERSFAARPTIEEPQTDSIEESFIAQTHEDSQEGTPSSMMEDSQVTGSQLTQSQQKKRKRGRAMLTISKRRKANAPFVYNTTGVIRFKSKPPFIQPPDMLDYIVVADDQGWYLDHPDLPSDNEDETVQVPATTNPSRRRSRLHASRSENNVNGTHGQQPEGPDGSRKRRRASQTSQDVEEPVRVKSKRQKLTPATPSTRNIPRSSSTHYVDVTPGDRTSRRGSRSLRTDTPEADAIVSQARQSSVVDEPSFEETAVIESTYDHVDGEGAADAGAQLAGQSPMLPSTPPIVPEPQEQTRAEPAPLEEQPTSDLVDLPSEDQSSHRPSRAPSLAPSLASSTSSTFSVGAFKDVMARFVDQIRDFVKGGVQQEEMVEDVAEAMADEANRAVEKLVRAAGKNK